MPESPVEASSPGPSPSTGSSEPSRPSRQQVRTELAEPSRPSRQQVRTELAEPSRPSRQQVRTELAEPSRPSRQQVHTELAEPSRPSRQQVRTELAEPSRPSRQQVHTELAEPTRPSRQQVRTELAEAVVAVAGPGATPRAEQLEAVTAVVADRRRTLLVARTGFGKSAVYFSATAMLRRRGWGPTVVVSPLLALMRDQVNAAQRLGLRAVTINSSNVDDWELIEQQIAADDVDLMLIAPERLSNPGFRRRVFAALQRRAFMLVCDEAHCISDWGHDFRPDYRRLRQLLADLPPWTPVLATTATANQRVTDDVAAQLGDDTVVLRTSLDRASLHLSVVDLPDDAHRLAWLGEQIPALRGSGIIYSLTVAQAHETADFLRSLGHDVLAYTGQVDAEERLMLEERLRQNDVKALVATSALGMGFDKGDLAFCVHLGLPPSPVAYYQQIGRAGRSIDRAEVIAMPRPDQDARIWRWFESVAMPSEQLCITTLDQLNRHEPTGIADLERWVNLGRSRLSTLLNILEVDGAVERVGSGWIRSGRDWTYDHQMVNLLAELRRAESEEMLAWANLDGCRLRFLREALDDPDAADCGRCDHCAGPRWSVQPSAQGVAKAAAHLQGGDVVIEARKQWPTRLTQPKGRIRAEAQCRPGRALARVGDGGWDPVIESLLSRVRNGQSFELTDELVRGCAAVLKRWQWDARPTWICPMPSRRSQRVIDAVAEALGALGKLPVFEPLVCEAEAGEGFQADQANSAHQVAAVWRRFRVDTSLVPDGSIPSGPVLLVDDEVDSRWTLTVAAMRLHEAGAGPVLPFALRAR